GQRCVWNGVPECAAAGTKKSSQACEDDCVEGYRCHETVYGNMPICHRYCRQDADCPGPGSLCSVTIGDPTVKLCSHNCDPVTDTGCDELTNKCDIFREANPPNRPFTQCVEAGGLGQDEVCTSSSQCARGSSCFTITGQTDSYCLTWCRIGAVTTTCPSGTDCGTFDPPIQIGSVQYGACLSP
ncbi:MAG: hypothetical protein JRI23_21370, partial [Deltaproteobacteria bacterium]|nr:hypothetical protein [Deltaproteobacteria bacterium]MBW2534492.1 hypothetical protein [Deltaproteobacteria bacterium]